MKIIVSYCNILEKKYIAELNYAIQKQFTVSNFVCILNKTKFNVESNNELLKMCASTRGSELIDQKGCKAS